MTATIDPLECLPYRSDELAVVVARDHPLGRRKRIGADEVLRHEHIVVREGTALHRVLLIALPGDFSDDGQPVHMRGLKKVLDDYANKHGIQFFAAPGNHDPNKPLERAGGKADYLGIDPTTNRVGAPQPIYSRGGNGDCAASNYSGEWAKVNSSYCTEEVKEQGYAGITEALDQHGLMPKAGYRYFETPYSSYSYQNYDFAKAKEQASWSRRSFEICAQGAGGTYKKDGYTFCHDVPDTSYLVEPVEGLWLVGIDANVYVPTGTGPNDFNGSGDAGYNKMLTHKPHVIDQHAALERVAQRVRHQVVEDARQHHVVAAHPQVGLARHQPQALLFGHRAEVAADLVEQPVEREVDPLRLQHAGVELREVQQLGEQPVERVIYMGVGEDAEEAAHAAA